jgi:hypothetical protein
MANVGNMFLTICPSSFRSDIGQDNLPRQLRETVKPCLVSLRYHHFCINICQSVFKLVSSLSNICQFYSMLTYVMGTVLTFVVVLCHLSGEASPLQFKFGVSALYHIEHGGQD